jgi:hypothetical protein
MIGGAAMAAPAGIVLGTCYGATQAIIYGNASAFLPAVIHFTWCAAAAGAILGAFVRLADDPKPLTTRGRDAAGATADREVTALKGHWHYRLFALSRIFRRR